LIKSIKRYLKICLKFADFYKSFEYMGIITLLTDFGTKDSYVSEMKGVINALIPDVTIIDISHEVRPQNILEASFILSNSFYYFPGKTVHLTVVDPGVGTSREILVVNTRNYIFIGPDNGVLYESVNKDGIDEIKSVNIEQFRNYMLNLYRGNIVAERIFSGEASKTFHGRDIFAPLAAFCLLDDKFEKFTVRKSRLIKCPEIRPVLKGNKINGKVIYIDNFGNLITNINHELINQQLEVTKDYKKVEVFIKLKETLFKVGELQEIYSNVNKGEPLALIGSRGYIEISVNCGDAAGYFRATGDEEVVVILTR